MDSRNRSLANHPYHGQGTSREMEIPLKHDSLGNYPGHDQARKEKPLEQNQKSGQGRSLMVEIPLDRISLANHPDFGQGTTQNENNLKLRPLDSILATSQG